MTPTPAVVRQGREKVARVLDPIAWSDADNYRERADAWFAKGRTEPNDCLVDGYRDTADQLILPSLAKADAILALNLQGGAGSDKRQDAKIARLQRALVRYGDRVRMATAADMSLQAEIDEAMELFYEPEQFAKNANSTPAEVNADLVTALEKLAAGEIDASGTALIFDGDPRALIEAANEALTAARAVAGDKG